MKEPEVLRVLIDSMPATEPAWFEVLSALLIPAIALIALYIAYQQYKINKQRLRHETYERRLYVYKVVQKFLSEIIREGKTTYEMCAEFYSEASEAAFLFDDSVQNKIDEIYKKAVQMVHLCQKMYPLDGSTGLPVGEERSRIAEEESGLLLWLTDQLKESRPFFAEKLGLKNK